MKTVAPLPCKPFTPCVTNLQCVLEWLQTEKPLKNIFFFLIEMNSGIKRLSSSLFHVKPWCFLHRSQTICHQQTKRTTPKHSHSRLWTGPCPVLPVRWHSSRLPLTAGRAGPESSPHFGIVPPWWRTLSQDGQKKRCTKDTRVRTLAKITPSPKNTLSMTQTGCSIYIFFTEFEFDETVSVNCCGRFCGGWCVGDAAASADLHPSCCSSALHLSRTPWCCRPPCFLHVCPHPPPAVSISWQTLCKHASVHASVRLQLRPRTHSRVSGMEASSCRVTPADSSYRPAPRSLRSFSRLF